MQAFRTTLNIPLSDEVIATPDAANLYLPASDSAEIKYMKSRRMALGGYLPLRRPAVVKQLVQIPGDEVFGIHDAGSM